jgi:hypothetical protein
MTAKFSVVPARALFDTRLNQNDILLLNVLCMYIDENGECFPSLDTLSKIFSPLVGRDTPYDRSSMSKKMDKLEELGYVRRKGQRVTDSGSFQSNVWIVIHDGILPIEFNRAKIQPPIESPKNDSVEYSEKQEEFERPKNAIQPPIESPFLKGYRKPKNKGDSHTGKNTIQSNVPYERTSSNSTIPTNGNKPPHPRDPSEESKSTSELWNEMESASQSLGEISVEQLAMGKLRDLLPYGRFSKSLRARVAELAAADEGLVGLENGLAEFRRKHEGKPFGFISPELLIGFWEGALNTAHAAMELETPLPVVRASQEKVFGQGPAF